MTNEKRQSKPNQRKIDTIESLSKMLAKSKAFFLTDFKGLTHKQLEELRKNLKKVDAEYVIAKNTLLKKSLESSNNKNKESMYDSLKNSTAALFAYGDELSAIKTVYDFAKNFTFPKIKIGIFGDNLITNNDYIRLASIPSKEFLLSTLVFRLKSPIYGFHHALNWNLQKFVIALNNIKNSKTN